MKSLEFFKPTLVTTLAIVLAWLPSIRPAQAGYTVKLQQVGTDVVATGSGTINLSGLTFVQSSRVNPGLRANGVTFYYPAVIFTGPIPSNVDVYSFPTGPTSFGFGSIFWPASSGSGYMVGIVLDIEGNALTVPRGYVSGTALSGMATYTGKNFATLGVRPGTYVWTWGIARNQNFTLQILAANPTPTPTPTEW